MSLERDHFSRSDEGVSLCKAVSEQQGVLQSHRQDKRAATAGSGRGCKAACNTNVRRSVEKHVHSVPQPASLCGIVQRTSRSAWSIHFDGLSRRQFAHDAASQQQHSSDCRVRSKISHTISRGNLAVVEHSGAQS